MIEIRRHAFAALCTGLPICILFGIRDAEADDELWACSRLRAACFYVYPPEREFAGRVRLAFSV